MVNQLFENIEQEYKKYIMEIGGRIICSDKPGLHIKEKRMAYCITQDEMGQILNLRRETISRIENGVINPTFDFVKNFSRTLALTKIIREMNAMDEISVLNSGRVLGCSTCLLRVHLGYSGQNLNINLISEIGGRSYQKSRNKVIKRLKS